MKIKYFKPEEFKCKCGCGENKFKSHIVLSFLETLRRTIKKPIKILSGYRCPLHNARVGGSKHSQHMEGKAVDFTILGMSWEEAYINVISLYKKFPEIRLGIYPENKFFHIDSKHYDDFDIPNQDSLIWIRRGHKYIYRIHPIEEVRISKEEFENWFHNK